MPLRRSLILSAAVLAWCGVSIPQIQTGAIAEAAPRMSRQCQANAGGRIDSVLKVYYPKFRSKTADDGTTWFARKDLEVARHYLDATPDNQVGYYSASGALCSAADTRTPEYKALQKRFAEAEAKVKEMETARGVRFQGVVKGNHIAYVGLDGTPVEHSDQI